MRKEKLE
jgi:Ca2+-binding EF-hand superfamily protein